MNNSKTLGLGRNINMTLLGNVNPVGNTEADIK